ncbi:MAG: D-tyrosyl-tRNA(Tyr) deacylase [Candidatus Omnitrophota bacterium]|nr:MAG: D-tyrosyl-tRNA(Tyr) deacylase [Candidatus Omnitrophota bacterium]
MKVLVARVSKGCVSVGGKIHSSIERGIAVFAGIEPHDREQTLIEMAQKITNLRIFENEEGKLHYSVKDKSYQVLCISNFTLCADTKKGRRPSFENAMEPVKANRLFENFVLILKSMGNRVCTGAFGKHMDISLDLDGPVNITLESSRL